MEKRKIKAQISKTFYDSKIMTIKVKLKIKNTVKHCVVVKPIYSSICSESKMKKNQ